MVEPEVALATNRAGWNRVAPLFHGGTALPEYGPLAPTEDTLRLLDSVPVSRVLELGCGSGHSLRYLGLIVKRVFQQKIDQRAAVTGFIARWRLFPPAPSRKQRRYLL